MSGATNETATNADYKGSVLEPSQSHHFSSEEVQQIIALAMQRAEFSSREQLEEIAQELSIEKGAITYAIETWQSQKLKDKKKQRRRQQFYRYELIPYVVVNAFLIGLNISISGAISWAIYPLMGWGTAVLISFLSGTSTGCFHKLSTGRSSGNSARNSTGNSALKRSVGY